jgi:hypothetical protein
VRNSVSLAGQTDELAAMKNEDWLTDHVKRTVDCTLLTGFTWIMQALFSDVTIIQQSLHDRL